MSRIVIKNGHIVGGEIEDIAIVDGVVAERGANIEIGLDDEIIDAAGLMVAPAFVDVHVHLREPGYGYKERIETGTRRLLYCLPNAKPQPCTR